MSDSDELRPKPLNFGDEPPRYPIETFTRGRRSGQDVPELSGKMPPQAIDIEQAVLGAMMLEVEAIAPAIEVIGPESFYKPEHRKVYEAIRGLFEKGHPVDIITVAEELKRRGTIDEVGGPYFLSQLTGGISTSANVEHHARIVVEKSLLRKLISTMNRLATEAYDPSSDAFDLLDKAEREIFEISESQLRRTSRSMGDVLKDTLKRLESIHGREGGITGVGSGFHRIDELTSGWQSSDLIVVAARPSMGKTAFTLRVARNAALDPKTKTGVVIFSLEMSAGQLAQRLLTAEARIDAHAARTGRLHDDDWPHLARAAGRLSQAPIFIDDSPGLGVLEIRAKARRLKAEHDIGLVIVDYLQLMHGSGNSKQNREQEIAQISRSLKALAKELDIPVIAVSQLSRAVETRGGDRRPMLSDLRESGSIEQDADVVIFIYRAERYGILVDDNGNSTEGLSEILISKQRNGPVGTVRLAWLDQYATFENLTTYYAGGDSDSVGGDGVDGGPPSLNPPDKPPF
jgi:replicative DNA helicase